WRSSLCIDPEARVNRCFSATSIASNCSRRITSSCNACVSASAGGRASGRSRSANSASSSASLRSVLALTPRPLAKFRTHDGLTAATAIPAVHNPATTWRCSPPVASTTTNCGLSSPNRPTRRLIPARSLASVIRSPPGRTATTSSALLTSIPTYHCSAIAPLLLGRPTLPCPMRARALSAARSTVRAVDALASERGDPCSPAAFSDPGSCGLPRPPLSWYADSQIQGSLYSELFCERIKIPPLLQTHAPRLRKALLDGNDPRPYPPR